MSASDWIEPPQPKAPPRRLLVKVKSVPPSNVATRAEYEGLFRSSFDAYDDALSRFPHAQRIELEPLPPKAAKQEGGRHGR